MDAVCLKGPNRATRSHIKDRRPICWLRRELDRAPWARKSGNLAHSLWHWKEHRQNRWRSSQKTPKTLLLRSLVRSKHTDEIIYKKSTNLYRGINICCNSPQALQCIDEGANILIECSARSIAFFVVCPALDCGATHRHCYTEKHGGNSSCRRLSARLVGKGVRQQR